MLRTYTLMLTITLGLLAPACALAQGGLLSLLGQQSQQPASGDPSAVSTDPATTTTPPAGAWRIPSLSDLRGLIPAIPKVEITADEKAALGRLKSTLWGLAGPNERFCYGDLDDIVYQLRGELGQRVDAEIQRRASIEASRGIFPRIRGRIVDRHVSRNYGSYYSQGMALANDRVRSGLSQWLRETGCQVNVPDAASDSRRLTLASLEQLAQDAPVLRAINDRAAALGLPGFTFPRGMGWRDLEAIENSRIPPNGQMTARPAARAASR